MMPGKCQDYLKFMEKEKFWRIIGASPRVGSAFNRKRSAEGFARAPAANGRDRPAGH
jgi:hypothetical protein